MRAYVPNALTLLRIVLVPVLVVVLLTEFDGKEWWGLGLFLVAALTDFLDGYLARRWKEVSRLGKLLDPAADKILTAAAFISLVELEVAPSWMVTVIVAREFAVSALRAFAATEQVVIPAGVSGKVKTVVQVIAISLLIIHGQIEALFPHLAPISLWVAVVISVYSGIEYFIRFGRLVLNGAPPPPTETGED
ncbi:MAG TPA: CDP-diacylglycerol--glycerol-3-phosphate 3-phosphatidyltransferase [Thermoanaerobaculia bacterium]|nr:CDP-diacylglycerol--glycerol-3-phosphate 3-phosphatidyltransferase [Thermoanaerobaculia bacterium]